MGIRPETIAYQQARRAAAATGAPPPDISHYVVPPSAAAVSAANARGQVLLTPTVIGNHVVLATPQVELAREQESRARVELGSIPYRYELLPDAKRSAAVGAAVAGLELAQGTPYALPLGAIAGSASYGVDVLLRSRSAEDVIVSSVADRSIFMGVVGVLANRLYYPSRSPVLAFVSFAGADYAARTIIG